jgi:hypothetical protein
MGSAVELLQELPAEEANLGAEGCCALVSFTTCPNCSFLGSNV